MLLELEVDTVAVFRVQRHHQQQAKQSEELSLELMKVDKASEARKARRDWLRLMKVSPGIWVKAQVRIMCADAMQSSRRGHCSEKGHGWRATNRSTELSRRPKRVFSVFGVDSHI